MEKKLSNLGITLLFSILSINYGIAQGDQKYDGKKHIKLDNDSEIKEIILQVRDSVNSLTIKVQSNIEGGELTVEILDPKGDNRGNFSIAGKISNKGKNKSEYPVKSGYFSNPDKATGYLSRTIRKPQSGDWKIRIIPKEAVGTINIDYAQKSLASIVAPAFIILK